MGWKDLQDQRLARETSRKKRSSKYGNVRTKVGELRFDSRAEARRWGELCLLELAGEIVDLKRQVSFPLDVTGKYGVCRRKYIADFTYLTRSGKLVVEDVKGVRTDIYKWKKALMGVLHGIEVIEVRVKSERAQRGSGKAAGVS